MSAMFRWLRIKITRPLYRFRWYRWHLYQRRLKAKPRAEITDVVTIYAHAFGSDVEGDGSSVKTAYRTLARATRDLPTTIPPGMQYTVDVTGLHEENLPTDYNVFASEEDEKREREIQRLQKLLTDAEIKAMTENPITQDDLRVYTPEEMRAKFIWHLHKLKDYWLNEAREPSAEGKLYGLVHSLLCTFDGVSHGMPAFDIVPHPSGESRWVPTCINTDAHLNEDWEPEWPEQFVELIGLDLAVESPLLTDTKTKKIP